MRPRWTMRIFDEAFPTIGQPFAVCIGKFDGLHTGHQQLLHTLLQQAKRHGALSLLYTFVPRGGDLLTLPEERAALARALGMDCMAVAELNDAFMALEAEEFVERLKNCGTLKAVVVGDNFRFGRGAVGDAALLRRLGARDGYDVHVVPQVCLDGQVVSSTAIRQALAEGRMEQVTHMLGRHWTLSGTVATGRQIGRTIGFRTANLPPPAGKLLPPYGVYATWARTAEGEYPAMTNIGVNPTVDGSVPVVETHLIDFEGDLYGKPLTLRFVHRLRPELRFASLDELVAQMNQDREDSLRALCLAD